MAWLLSERHEAWRHDTLTGRCWKNSEFSIPWCPRDFVECPSIWLCLVYVKVLVAQSCPIFCNPMGCSLPGSSVPGIPQGRILEWVAIFSRGSSQPRDQTWVSCIADRFFTDWATREAPCFPWIDCGHAFGEEPPQVTWALSASCQGACDLCVDFIDDVNFYRWVKVVPTIRRITCILL